MVTLITDSGAPKIRVCQFAKEESIHANRASPSPSDHVPIENVEVITLSSEDEAKPSLQPPLRKTKRKPKQKRKINCPISKAPLQYNYHKITEYFGITKVERKSCFPFPFTTMKRIVAIVFLLLSKAKIVVLQLAARTQHAQNQPRTSMTERI